MSNLIDTSGLKFFDAPLETIGENEFRDLNKLIVSSNGVGFGAINPHLYNKSCFINFSGFGSDVGANGGAILDWGVGVDNRKWCTIGTTYHYNADAFSNPNIDDYAVYIELAPLTEISSNGFYDNIETISTGYKYVRSSPQSPTYSQWDDMGKTYYGINNGVNKTKPTPTRDYDGWLYVKKFRVYNRANGDTNSRNELAYSVVPMILFDCQNLYYYRYDYGKPKAEIYNGNFQGGIIANFNAFFFSLWQLYNWRFVNVSRTDPQIDDWLGYFNQIVHKSRLGDNIKLLQRSYGGDDIIPWIAAGIFGAQEFIYRYSSDSLAERATLAFKSFDDFVWLLNDWGISKITDDLDTARNMPSELFPDYSPPDGAFNPDGGNNTGFDDNKTIENLPSYPDNTSDTITPQTPNISAINAASVYALDLLNVKTLLNWLMTENFTKNISELFSDKLSALDDLKLFPIDIVNHDTLHTENSATLTIANVSSNVNCYKILPNYNCIINGGQYHYTAYWGNFKDYTDASYYLYIPYGGIVELSPSHVVNRDLRLEYAVDIMTGNATAIIYSNGVLVKTVPCQMGQTIPITYTNTNQREIRNALTALNAGTSIVNMAAGRNDVFSGVLGIVNSAATNAMTNPLKFGSIGNFSSGTSLIMPQNPFLIISRIQQAIPANRNNIIGIPSNINTKISDFVGSGFVQINATNINSAATTEEQNQIINLLRGGIFI